MPNQSSAGLERQIIRMEFIYNYLVVRIALRRFA